MKRQVGLYAGLSTTALALVLVSVSQASAAFLVVESTSALQGELVSIDVILVTSQGEQIPGTQNDIIFDPTLVDLESLDACVINPAISDSAPGCATDPSSAPCKQLESQLDETGDGKKRFRALVLSLVNDTNIPDGIVYTCRFRVAVDAARGDVIPLICRIPRSDGPEPPPVSFCQSGLIQLAEPPRTATASPTGTPTQPPTSTRPEATITPRPMSSPPSQDDGCQIGAPTSSNAGWVLIVLLLIPLTPRRTLSRHI